MALLNRFKTALIATTLTYALAYSPAQAQTSVETVQSAKFDCSHEKQFGKGLLNHTASWVGVSEYVKEVTNSRRRKYALIAAKNALKAGYNYAYMEPLQVSDRRRSQRYTTYSGFSYNATVGRRYKLLSCYAMDDVTAYETLMGRNAERINEGVNGVVDLRVLLSTFDEGPYSKPRKPQIALENFRNVGDRERVTKQYPVMAKALACRTDLRPTSISSFTYKPSASEAAAEKSCLAGLKQEAQSVGLAFSSIVNDDVADRGYNYNRPSAAPAKVALSGAPSVPVDADTWGKDWSDFAPSFPSMSGKVMSGGYKNGIVLVASNSLSENDLMDHAVFVSAANMLEDRNHVLKFKTKTEVYRKSFESTRKRQIDNAAKEAESKRNKAQVNLKNKRTVSAGNVAAYEGYLQDRKDKIAFHSNPPELAPEDFASAAEMVKSIPGETRDLETIKKDMVKGQQRKNAADLAFHTRKLSVDEAKLEGKRATYARETLELEQATQALDLTPVSTPVILASQSKSAKTNAGIYKMFEDYSIVIILNVTSSSSDTPCTSEYIVCADKIQAYNTLGNRLNPTGFASVSKPAGYKSYSAQ